jgi:hypothetical protein
MIILSPLRGFIFWGGAHPWVSLAPSALAPPTASSHRRFAASYLPTITEKLWDICDYNQPFLKNHH